MASLHIAEFSQTNVELGNAAQVAACPPVAEQKLTIGASSVPSTAFNAATRVVRLKTDANCCLAWGAAPVATTNNMPMVAGDTEYFGILSGLKLAVIANA